MNWYFAKIIFRIVCGEGDHKPQFDEQLRLVAAQDDKHAFSKAQDIGEREATSFYNHVQQLVEWKFVDVCEIYKMTELIDGAELYSRIQEVDDADTYIDLAHKRADFVRENSMHHHLQLIEHI